MFGYILLSVEAAYEVQLPENRDMGFLEQFYQTLLPENFGMKVEIPHSLVSYTRYLVRDKLGIEMTADEIKTILYEEGLLPAKEYKIPSWYQKKYQMM